MGFFLWFFPLVCLGFLLVFSSLVVFSVVPFVSVLGGISFLLPPPGYFVSLFLVLAVQLFPWLVGPFPDPVPAIASNSVDGALMASGASTLFLVLAGRPSSWWILASLPLFLFSSSRRWSRSLDFSLASGWYCHGDFLYRSRSSGTIPFILRSIAIHFLRGGLLSVDFGVFQCRDFLREALILYG